MEEPEEGGVQASYSELDGSDYHWCRKDIQQFLVHDWRREERGV